MKDEVADRITESLKEVETYPSVISNFFNQFNFCIFIFLVKKNVKVLIATLLEIR